MGMTTWVFPEKLKKNDMRAPCFSENGRFLTAYEHESRVFFREWTFLSYGHEINDFFVKIEIERAFPIYFFGQ